MVLNKKILLFSAGTEGPSRRITIVDAINNRRKTVLERKSQLTTQNNREDSLVFDNAAFDDTEY